MDRTIKRELIESSRIQNNLTIKQFCKKCHISTDTYYKIINTEKCNMISLIRIAQTMNIDFKVMFPLSTDNN